MSISVDDCIDLDGMERSILAKVKDLSVISELLKHMSSEGFDDVGLRYVGGRWVVVGIRPVVFKWKASDFKRRLKKLFFGEFIRCFHDFIPDERCVWIDLVGLPLASWAPEVYRSWCGRWEAACLRICWIEYMVLLTSDEIDSDKRWSYRDPNGNIHGLFSLPQLRSWKDYNPSDLQIWSYYGNVKEAILLHNALSRQYKRMRLDRFWYFLMLGVLVSSWRVIQLALRFLSMVESEKVEAEKAIEKIYRKLMTGAAVVMGDKRRELKGSIGNEKLDVLSGSMDQRGVAVVREGTATRVNLDEYGATCNGNPNVISSPLVSPTATLIMPHRVPYDIDVAATFGVPLTTVGDLHMLINDVEAGKHDELLSEMTNDDRMETLDALVIVGNGSSIPVTHSGHVQIPNPYRPLHLRNVLVTPNIIKNLVSVQKFTTDNKCSIDFDPYGFTVRDYHTRKTLFRCDSTGDLYPLHVASSAFALLTNNHSLSHQRLGHPSDAANKQNFPFNDLPLLLHLPLTLFTQTFGHLPSLA
ncbi:ribonuclease H-like domain-containing protein [Tanacetum coccineum]